MLGSIRVIRGLGLHCLGLYGGGRVRVYAYCVQVVYR